MSLTTCEISLSSANVSNNQSLISNRDNSLLFTGVDRYDFDNDVYAKNVKLANENDIQNLQNEIDSILPLSNYAYINGNDETSQLGGIPFGTGSINTLIQSPDFLYDNINKVVKVDNINLATQTQIDTLQTEIDNIPVPNPNVWVNSDGITTTNNLIPFTDGSSNGMKTDSAFSYQVYDDQNFLTVGSAQLISSNNNMKLESTDYILTNKDFYLQGTEDIQRYLTVGRVGLNNNVKTSVDITTSDYICDNQIGSKTKWKGASEYDFDNNIISSENVILNNAKALTLNNNFDVDNIKLYKQNTALGSFVLDNQSGSKTDFRGASSYLFSNDVSIGDNTTSKKLYLNNVEIKPPVQFLNNYYVSPSGTNALGDGSISNPWGTISHAISTLSAIVGDIQVTINISAGTYTENLTINKSGIALIGASSNLPNLTTINGNILFDMTNNTSFFSVGGLENIQLNGTLEHRQTNIYTNSLNVINCLFFAPSGKSAIGTIGTGGGLLGNMTIQASLIYMCDNTIAVDINNTAISMINTQLTNSPLLAVSATSFITVSGAGRINLFGCSIFQSSSVSTVDPLIVVNNNSTVTSSSTINSCILVYTSGASDAGTGNKCCVKFSGSASMNTYNLVYNYFRCVGATTGAPNNQCIQKLGTAALAIIFGSNVAGSPAHHVAPASGSYTKTALSAVI